MTFGERAGQKPATSFPDLPSLGTPLLSEPRRVKSFPSVFVEEPEGAGLPVNSPAASAMRHGQGCRSWHHHTFFFLAGVLCSFVVFSLSSHFAHLPNLLSRPTVWGGPPPASSPLSSSCQVCCSSCKLACLCELTLGLPSSFLCLVLRFLPASRRPRCFFSFEPWHVARVEDCCEWNCTYP